LSQDSGQSLSDTDILAIASDELQNVIAPKIYAYRGWHYAAEQLYSLGTTRRYRMPSRCAGGTIVSVEIVNATPPNRFVNYTHPLQVENTNGQVTNESYYVYANNIVLSSGCPSTGQMIVKYLIPPGSLTTFSDTINGFGHFTISVNAENIGLQINDLFDIMMAVSPYEILMKDVQVASIAGTTITLNNDLLTDAGVQANSTIHDYTSSELVSASNTGIVIVRAGQAQAPQLSDEHHDLLAQRTAMRCMEAIGHSEDLENMEKKLADLEAAFNKSISPRERGDIKVIIQEDFFYDRRF
jgi:hypothetical protein